MSLANRFAYVADECLASSLVADLRDNGFDVQWVHEFDRSAPDPKVMSHALERQRLLITQDFDFGDLSVRFRMPTMGVVILYLSRLSRSLRSEIVLRELDAHADRLVGHLLIIEPGRTRLRPLDE